MFATGLCRQRQGSTRTKTNPEKAAVETYGGQLLFSSGDVVFSSIDLLRREFSEVAPHALRKPPDYPKRHGFDIAMIKRTLDKLPTLRILVIGDLIVDDYIACDALGMSQEDPSIVVTPVLTERFVGGAEIVAEAMPASSGSRRISYRWWAVTKPRISPPIDSTPTA